MKTPLFLRVLVLLLLADSSSIHAATPTPSPLAELAAAHEQVFRSLGSDGQVSLVLQKGDKQFVIYGVTGLRAVGSTLEVTVKNGRKYSVSPADVYFLSNDTFGLK